ncbi:hypothetical protein BZARG_1541 [Bizionia argentinensis JUB59]|uniref:DUF3575 domain-containing protein n=1 Tax=Bizionia argentinensis JUB59 TaxID=1046627 RepID=G2EA35_9FLAO|nr:hypothetical protein [Bizionia argentinensis]EGV44692.1 hypothetical protein BZARG_1541 [Bizionia argentinensis JUB59]
MKKLKTKLIITLLTFGTSVYAQSKDSLITINNVFNSVSLNSNINSTSYDLDLNNINLPTKNLLFSSINKTTQLNDNYLVINEAYIYHNSNFLFENKFKGSRIDSYNPYGASNINSALFLGVVGVFLNKIQK